MSAQFAVALTGANTSGRRESADFYATPPECVLGLIQAEGVHLRGKRILEPCCGDGAISRVLIASGLEVISTDLCDRAFGLTGVDFLQTKSTDCDAVVTNPPFSLSEDMIAHALETLHCSYVAMLLKQNFWSARSRARLFSEYPPSISYTLTWRPDFSGGGRPTMDCQWVVWDRSRPGEKRLELMERPKRRLTLLHAVGSRAGPTQIMPSS